MSIRWGLCCQFLEAPIRFRQATHRYVATLGAEEREQYLTNIARANAIALAHAVIAPADVPESWLRLALEGRRFTVDVEAKDKERAVLAIRDATYALLAQRRSAAGTAVTAAFGDACVVPSPPA